MTQPTLLELALRFLRRAFAADFQREHATDDERAALAAQDPPIADALAQDYLAWRRAALWIGGVLLSASGLVSMIEHHSIAEASAIDQARAAGQPTHGAEFQAMVAKVAEQIGKGNLAIMDGLLDFLLFVKVAVATLAMIAAWRWTRLRQSRSLARWALLTALVLPLLVSAWPWSQWLDFSHQGPIEVAKVTKAMVAAEIAGQLIVAIAPKLIALFPGIMRSSLALKTLLPEAAAPGWLVVVFAPFLAGFLLLALCLLGQVQGSWVLLGGVAAMVAAPILYLRHAALLVRPYRADEVGPAVGAVRGIAGKTNAIGAALLVWYLFDLDGVTWLQAFHLLCEAIGGIFLTMVAISDLTLALLAFSQRQNTSFFGSELRVAYEQRLQALTGSGLTDVESALGVKDLAGLQKLRRSPQP